MRLCVVTCVCLSLSFVIMFSIMITWLKLIMQPTNTKAIYQDTFVPVNHSDSPLCNCSQPQQNVQDQCWRCTFLNGGVCPIFCRSAEHQIWGRWSCGKSSRAVTQSVAFTRKTRRCWSFGYSLTGERTLRLCRFSVIQVIVARRYRLLRLPEGQNSNWIQWLLSS